MSEQEFPVKWDRSHRSMNGMKGSREELDESIKKVRWRVEMEH